MVKKKKLLPQSVLLCNYNKALLHCALELTKHMHISIILQERTERERFTPLLGEVKYLALRLH